LLLWTMEHHCTKAAGGNPRPFDLPILS
jgi:hypothetical protein